MTETLKKVGEFHAAFGAVTRESPEIGDEAVNQLRLRLLQEELDELKEALEKGDVVEVLDALTDLQYVLDGAFLAFGLHGLKKAAFDEVHRSNMSKLGRDGKPVLRPSDNKVLKGPDFSPPDLKAVLESRFGLPEAAE